MLLLIIVSCNKKDIIEGEWEVSTDFHKATYAIFSEGDYYKGKVLFYNDGTTNYKAKEAVSSCYLFDKLYKKEKVYVDGVSGATSQNNRPKTISIKVRHQDTLDVYSYIMRDSTQELWIRKQKSN